MNWFTNLSSALGGSGNSQPSSTPSGGESTKTTVFNNTGEQVQANPAPTPQSNTPAAPAPAPAPSIESLLFDPVPATNTPAAQQPNQQQQNQQPNSPTEVEIVPGTTATQLMQKLGSVNFAQNIPPEMMQKALSGDQQAFSQILNGVAQLAAGIAVQQSTVFTNGLIDNRFNNVDSLVSTKVNDSGFNAVLADPQFSNPFIQPLAADFVKRMRERDPTITPEQVRTALPKLIQHSMQSFQGTNPQNQQQQQPRQQVRQSGTPTELNYDELFNGG